MIRREAGEAWRDGWALKSRVVGTVWIGRSRDAPLTGLGPEVRMDGSAGLFLCARCFVQVRLCSHCDRGQRYCTASCSSLARDAAQREAASRYQRSRGRRMIHAARSRRWRIRHHRIDPLATTQIEADANIVTHQGSPGSPADAPYVQPPHLDPERPT